MTADVAAARPRGDVAHLWQQLPRSFGDHADRQAGALVRNLPAVEELGWEARLGEPDAGLDHALCLKRGDGSLEAFLDWYATPPGQAQARQHPEWRRLGDFLRGLADDGPPYTWLDNCWLEFDLARRRATSDVPSLFVGLGPQLRGVATATDDRARLLQVVEAVRGAPVPGTIRDRLTRCWSALPDGAEIFQLGLMLPRDLAQFRLVVRGCREDQVLGYLREIGWQGHEERFRALVAKLFRLAFPVSIAITVGERVHPCVGFECHLGPRTPTLTPRWEDFAQFLIALGVCRPEAWDGLREWPGVAVLPGPGDGEAGAGPYAIKGFDHVKVSYGDGYPLEAKLYFGALVKRPRPAVPGDAGRHLARSWRRSLLVGELSGLRRPQSAASAPLAASLGHLLREWCEDFPDATHVMTFPFLDGFRNDTEQQVGKVFPRALVADAMTDANELLRGHLDPLLGEEVATLLAERREGQGWAYFPGLSELPPDADTLAQVAQVLARNGARAAVEDFARPLLDQAVATAPVAGAVATWLLPAAGRTAAQERQGEFVRRAWGDTLDTEVIANFLHALALLGDDRRYPGFLDAGAGFVAAAMEPDGSWRSTWYQGPYYGTWVALRLLAEVRGRVPAESIDFLLRRQRPSGAWGRGEFEETLSTALALLGLLAARTVDPLRQPEIDIAVDRGLDWLARVCDQGVWGDEPFIEMDLHRAGGRGRRIVTWGSPTVTASYVLKAAVAAAGRAVVAAAKEAAR